MLKRILSLILCAILTMTCLCACSDAPDVPDNDIHGITDETPDDAALTILLCEPGSCDVELAISTFEERNGVKVDIKRYSDSEWDKFATKILSGDDSFDLYMPVNYYLGSVITADTYLDLSEFEDLASCLRGNKLAAMLADMDGTLIGVPCNVQATSTADFTNGAGTMIKYCYKNVDLYTGEFLDENGDELLEVLKNHCQNPDDAVENQYYDFDVQYATCSYLFMNKHSSKKELATELLQLLFDICNNDVEGATPIMPYVDVAEDATYRPSWIFYNYKDIQPLAEAFTQALETDGSDEALKKLAEDSIHQFKMHLEG